MRKFSFAVLAAVSAAWILPAQAITLDFPAPGFNFGVNQGLSLTNTGAFDSYAIDIRFSFDSVTASADGYQRILDFKNRTSDSGLYSQGGSLVLFSASGSGDPSASASGQVFFDRVTADLLVQRNSAGVQRLRQRRVGVQRRRSQQCHRIHRTGQHHPFFHG